MCSVGLCFFVHVRLPTDTIWCQRLLCCYSPSTIGLCRLFITFACLVTFSFLSCCSVFDSLFISQFISKRENLVNLAKCSFTLLRRAIWSGLHHRPLSNPLPLRLSTCGSVMCLTLGHGSEGSFHDIEQEGLRSFLRRETLRRAWGQLVTVIVEINSIRKIVV